MQISSGPTSWHRPQSLRPEVLLSAPVVHTEPQANHPGDQPALLETTARWIGRGARGIAMTPQFLQAHPWILEKVRLHGLNTLLEGSAALFGGISTLSLGISGGKDVADGFRHRNLAEALMGASDLTRAAYVGNFTLTMAVNHPLSAKLNPNLISKGWGLASGVLETAGGIVRMLHKKHPDNPVNPKVVGALEIGQGLAWSASIIGAPVALCFALKVGLSTAKALYIHQQNWQQWVDKKGLALSDEKSLEILANF